MQIQRPTLLLTLLALCPASNLAAQDGFDPNFEFDLSDITNEAKQDVGPKFTLRYQFREGEILRYETTAASELRIAVGEQGKSDFSRVHQIRRFEVDAVDTSGTAELLMRFESVEMSMRTDDGQPIIFKSSMTPAEVPRSFAHVADRLRSAAPRFTVAPTGAPLTEDGELARNDAQRPQDQKSDLAARLNAEPADADDNPETRLMLPLPRDPVHVGESWKYYNTVKLRVARDVNRSIRLLTSCRLQSVDDQLARITFRTSVVTRVRTPSVKALLIKALPSGHVLFDLRRGRIVERVVRNDNSVFGAYGNNSLLTMSAESIEKLLPAETTVSAR